jgi:hypothetical protein
MAKENANTCQFFCQGMTTLLMMLTTLTGAYANLYDESLPVGEKWIIPFG